MNTWLLTVLTSWATCAGQSNDSDAAAKGVAKIRSEAAALKPIVQSAMAQSFLSAAAHLPMIEGRVLLHDKPKRKYFSRLQASQLSQDVRSLLEEVSIDETYYYTTKYGTPLAYVRVLELYAGQVGGSLAGRRVLDFGYGTIGHLRMMAACGADVVGVEVDPMLRALYGEPGDQGRIESSSGPAGHIKLVHGRFPDIAGEVGGGYDLITSKNTLKNGFFHPERPVPNERLMDLGVDTREFVRILYAALKPGGVFIIYNICPAPSKPGEPYKHWADGRCPFSKDVLTSVGFSIVDYNADDNAPTRARAKALGWDRGEYAMDLENGLFGSYTILVRPRS